MYSKGSRRGTASWIAPWITVPLGAANCSSRWAKTTPTPVSVVSAMTTSPRHSRCVPLRWPGPLKRTLPPRRSSGRRLFDDLAILHGIAEKGVYSSYTPHAVKLNNTLGIFRIRVTHCTFCHKNGVISPAPANTSASKILLLLYHFCQKPLPMFYTTAVSIQGASLMYAVFFSNT